MFKLQIYSRKQFFPNKRIRRVGTHDGRVAEVRGKYADRRASREFDDGEKLPRHRAVRRIVHGDFDDVHRYEPVGRIVSYSSPNHASRQWNVVRVYWDGEEPGPRLVFRPIIHVSCPADDF